MNEHEPLNACCSVIPGADPGACVECGGWRTAGVPHVCSPPNLFWAEGWLVDLREHVNYPVYGEGDWTLRRDNAGIGFRG